MEKYLPNKFIFINLNKFINHNIINIIISIINVYINYKPLIISLFFVP